MAGGGGGAPKKIEPLARGAAKISSFEFQYLHPPTLVILHELSLSQVHSFLEDTFIHRYLR